TISYTTTYSTLFLIHCHRSHRELPSFPHDALPISARVRREHDCRHRAPPRRVGRLRVVQPLGRGARARGHGRREARGPEAGRVRSEEHTSELQSRENLVCRLLLEKKNTIKPNLARS